MRSNIGLCLCLMLCFSLLHIGLAQTPSVPVVCGQISEAELMNGSEYHDYAIQLRPGDKLSFIVDPIGDALAIAWDVLDPNNSVIAADFARGQYHEEQAGDNEVVENFEVGSTGRYIIRVTAQNVAGAYTLSIGCDPREGAPVNPGDPTATPATPPTQIPQISIDIIPTFGFPGLPPVDFSSAFLIPFTLGQTVNGQLPATSASTVGFTFNGQLGQRLNLQYVRKLGNLNVGIAIMSPTNKVVFQTVLISSDVLITRLQLDETGQYTIGVFRASVNSPITLESTSFELQGNIEP